MIEEGGLDFVKILLNAQVNTEGAYQFTLEKQKLDIALLIHEHENNNQFNQDALCFESLQK